MKIPSLQVPPKGHYEDQRETESNNAVFTQIGRMTMEIHQLRDQCNQLLERLNSLESSEPRPQFPKFYSTAKVADLTGYSECAIRNFRNLGIIKATGRSGKSYKFSEAAVRDFMNSPNLNAPRIKSQKPRKERGRGRLRMAA